MEVKKNGDKDQSTKAVVARISPFQVEGIPESIEVKFIRRLYSESICDHPGLGAS
jgi:hypothetical protein